MQKKIISCLLITIFLTSIFTIYKVLNKKNKSTPNAIHNNKKNVKIPEAILKNFKLQQIKQTSKENWTLTAKQGKIFYSTKMVECLNMKCSFNKNDKFIAILNAKKGLVNQNKKEAFLQGKVFGNLNELNFKGKNIKYNFETHTIETNEKTFLNHPKFKFMSNSSLTNIKKNKIVMNGNIETEIYLNR